MNILTSSFLFLLVICFWGTHIYCQDESFSMAVVGSNFLLDKPWDLNYGPDDYLWITEREVGVVVRIDPETAKRDELIQITEVYADAGQDGLLGMAIAPNLLNGEPYVYVSYTYLENNERRQKIVRFTYEITDNDGRLSDAQVLIDKLPASNDHNSGRLILGPDGKLYYTIGDQGANQLRNYCQPILSQILPSQEEIDRGDWSNYPGKVLRINKDGSIPVDNPILDGVQSHIWTYGHRNPQGLAFSKDGLLYSDEHGPNTDDEVNIILSGKNYGWPNVVGFQDDQAYDYCNWSTAFNCAALDYANGSCPSNATQTEESSFVTENYQEPLFSLFAVPDDYNFNDPTCDNSWICRPNVAPSSLAIYESDAIPAWNRSLLVVSLKRGKIFRLPLDENGTAIVGDTIQYFYTPNRYRDMVVAPDGKSFYIITDQSGRTSGPTGRTVVNNVTNPGAILKFTLQDAVNTKDQKQETALHVWPNPATDQINIRLNKDFGNEINGTLINANGQVIRRFSEQQLGEINVNTAGLPRGIYLLNINVGGYFYSKRLILQ